MIVAHLPHSMNYGYWIGYNTGLQRMGVFGGGTWHWVDNSPAGYTNWAEGEPNGLFVVCFRLARKTIHSIALFSVKTMAQLHSITNK